MAQPIYTQANSTATELTPQALHPRILDIEPPHTIIQR